MIHVSYAFFCADLSASPSLIQNFVPSLGSPASPMEEVPTQLLQKKRKKSVLYIKLQIPKRLKIVIDDHPVYLIRSSI